MTTTADRLRTYWSEREIDRQRLTSLATRYWEIALLGALIALAFGLRPPGRDGGRPPSRRPAPRRGRAASPPPPAARPPPWGAGGPSLGGGGRRETSSAQS